MVLTKFAGQIGKGSTIGNGCTIGAAVKLPPNTTVTDNTIFYKDSHGGYGFHTIPESGEVC